MMTSKQKWFIGKLMKEIEEAGNCEINATDLIYGCNQFDTYRTSKKDASQDIEYLLKVKEYMQEMSYDEARNKAIDYIYSK